MNQIICIVGPTGVGKTKLSIELAKIYNGEIINADSTQVYKGLDIATAKITEEEKGNIPHHLFDIKELDEIYTVYDYQRDCRQKIEEIKSRGKTPILVGGTGLYIKAALYDYELEEENIKTEPYLESTEELYQKLLKIDHNTKIHPHNRKRIERALHYYETTGKILGENKKASTLLYDTVIIGLNLDRDVLYERINNRTDIMMKQGLLEEANKLYDLSLRTKAIMTPIGYKELFEYFDGNVTLETAVEQIKQHCRNYAKRQYTWFRNQMDVIWICVDLDHFENTVSVVSQYIDAKQ